MTTRSKIVSKQTKFAEALDTPNSNTHVQFNDNGVLAGDEKLTWKKDTAQLSVGIDTWAPYKGGHLQIFDEQFDAYHNGEGYDSGLYVNLIGKTGAFANQSLNGATFSVRNDNNTVDQYQLQGLFASASHNVVGKNCQFMTGIQSEVFIQGVGTTVTKSVGVMSAVWFDVGSTMDSHIFFEAQNNRRTTGAITNMYGLKVADLTQGTNNWAIHTGLGPVSFGDDVTVRGSANSLTLDGATTTNPVTITATGTDASVPIKLAPKGPQGFVQLGPDTYGAAGWAGTTVGVELLNNVISSADSFGVYIEQYTGDVAASVSYGIEAIVSTQGAGAVSDNGALYGASFIARSKLPVGRLTNKTVGAFLAAGNSGAGTVTESIACELDDMYFGGGTITNLYGLKVYDMTTGTNNWAIKTGLGLVDLGDSLKIAKYLEGIEMTAPAAPAANGFRLFAEDDGSGKTRLMCIFASGAAQQVAIQP